MSRSDAPKDELLARFRDKCSQPRIVAARFRSMIVDTRRRRILFRATHRGTYENDILIGGFVRTRLDGFSEGELDEIERVMDLPDAMLADWLTGRQPIPVEADCAILQAMRQAALASKPSPAGAGPWHLALEPSPAGGRGQGEGGATSGKQAACGADHDSEGRRP